MGKNINPENRERKKTSLGRMILFAAFAVYVVSRFWSGPGPGPAPQAPQDFAPVVKESPTGFAAYDWPRSGGDKSPELAGNLAMKNYYVILDGSGSMDETRCSGSTSKMAAAVIALSEFAKAVPANAQLGLLTFDGRGVGERVPLGKDNRALFLGEVRKARPAGATPLRSAISMGIEKLEEQAGRQLGYGEYNLVVVTDGAATSGEDPTQVVNNILARSPVTLHTIGFCIGNDHSLNQPGRTLYKNAQSLEELRTGLGEVLAESESFDVSGFEQAAEGAGRP